MAAMKSFLSEVLDGLTCDYAEIRVEETESSRIAYRGQELDDIGRIFERGGCIRVFHRGNWGVATFNAIDENLKSLADDVVMQVEALPAREEMLASVEPFDEEVRIPAEEDPRRVPLAEKHALIRRYNDILLKNPGIVTTTSIYTDTHRFTCFYSTDSRYVDQESVYTGFACRAVAKDGTNIQDYHATFGKTRGFESLRNREPEVERIAKVALDLLRAEPVQAGKYTIVVDPLLAGVFAHEAFGHLSEADHISENSRLRDLMKVGTRFGVEDLTIIDDATLPGERGSYRYDDEGIVSERTELVRDGVLVGHLHDRQTAQRMEESVTGNSRALSYRFAPVVRMSNTFIEPRGVRPDAMLDSTPKGLYVAGSRGGMTELESFTFSSQYAYLIERGKKTKMVRDVTLSGNVFETLRNIAAIGDDLTIFGGIGGCGKAGQGPLPVGFGAPHIKVRDVVVGGR